MSQQDGMLTRFSNCLKFTILCLNFATLFIKTLRIFAV
jgi:hypothetical protein